MSYSLFGFELPIEFTAFVEALETEPSPDFNQLFDTWWNSAQFSLQGIEGGATYLRRSGDDVSDAFKEQVRRIVFGAVMSGAFTDQASFDRLLQQQGLVVEDYEYPGTYRVRILPREGSWGLYDMLYSVPTEEDPTGGWVYSQVGDVPAPELTYSQWLLTVAGSVEALFKQRYGEEKTMDEILKNTIYNHEYSVFVEAIRIAQNGDKAGLVSYLTDLPEDRQWIADSFIDLWGKAPGQGEWWAGFMADYDQQLQLIEAEQSISADNERLREQWVETYLGRKLSSVEQAVVKNYDSSMDAAAQSLYPEIAEAYVFFGVSGMSLTENRIQSRAQTVYESWLNNPNTPERFKQEFDDFDTLWRHYRQYTEAAFSRAMESQDTIGMADPDDLVPFEIESFSDWFNYRRAVANIELGLQLGTEVDFEPLRQALVELGLDPTAENAAFLQRQAGESSVEYYARITEQLNLDPDLLNLGISRGVIDPSTQDILDVIQPDIMQAMRTSESIARLFPNLREEFLADVRASLPNLWQYYVSRHPDLPAIQGDVASRAAAINQTSQQFIAWMEEENLLEPRYGFEAGTEQREAERVTQRYTPTRRVMPKSFGLGM